MKMEKTGKLSTRDRAMIWAVSEFLLWLGKALRKVETYEHLKELGPIVDTKMEEIDKKYPELAESNEC